MRRSSRYLKQGVVICLAFLLALGGRVIPTEPVSAITITMEYTDEGDPTPHPENPAWDPAGTILKAHFQRGKQIWEQLLPGAGSLEFDFQWDDDIGANTLGLTTDAGPFDLYIEINPNFDWYADPFPMTDDEFEPVGTPMLYGDLSQGEKDSFFLGNAPGGLETGYFRDGLTSPIGAGGHDANTGFDLLTVVLHEMGHALGIDGRFPLNAYPINGDLLGGGESILVFGGEGGHLAGNATIPGFLMCDACATAGGRYFPSATDVLVAAEANGITDVQLQRIGRISSGLWHEPNAWVGGDVPGVGNDVYITHGGTVTLGADAAANNLLIKNGGSLVVQDRILSVAGTLNFSEASGVSVDTGGIIYAGTIIRGSGDIATAQGSRVAFNSYEGGLSESASFNGSVSVGTGGGGNVPEVIFDPSTIRNWTIGGELEVGGLRSAHFVIREMSKVTSLTGVIGSGTPMGPAGRVTIDGGGSAWTIGTTLHVSGGSVDVTNGGKMQSESGSLGNAAAGASVYVHGMESRWDVTGDLTVGPMLGGSLGQAQVQVFDHGVLWVNGNLLVRGTSAKTSDVMVRSDGKLGVNGSVVVAPGGRLSYYDETSTRSGGVGIDAIENQGGTADNGTGGITRFYGNSTPRSVPITNQGGTAIFAAGGETHFYEDARAGSLFSGGATRIDNLSSAQGQGGATRFFGNSSGAGSEFYNHPSPGFNGSSLIEFNDDSTGGGGLYVNLTRADGVPSLGGAIIFNDRAKAGTARYESQGEGGVFRFNDHSSADEGRFFTSDNIGGNSRIEFFGDATAANAKFMVRRNVVVNFLERNTAANAEFTLDGGYLGFSGVFSPINLASTTAGNATIVAEGGKVSGAYGGHVGFSTWSTAGNATITAKGGTVSGALGGDISFDYFGQAGNATLIADGGVSGAGGGGIYFRRGATGDNARVIVNEGAFADFGGNRLNGGTTVGSIEGAGVFALNGSELRAGTRNTDTIVSGRLVDVPGTGDTGALTKIGTGQLTLSGTNTYGGLTTVQAGTLLINGSVVGDVRVAPLARLGGTGTIGGNVLAEPGAVLLPGASPGRLTVGGDFSLGVGGELQMEIGGTMPGVSYDVLAVGGDVSLDGQLMIQFIDGFAPLAGQRFDLIQIGGQWLSSPTVLVENLASGFLFETGVVDGVFGLMAINDGVFTGPGVPGDTNADGVVDLEDLNNVRNHFGEAGGLGDTNGDGIVSLEDLNAVRNNFGTTSGSPVPEPQTWVLLLVGLLAAYRLNGARSL